MTTQAPEVAFDVARHRGTMRARMMGLVAWWAGALLVAFPGVSVFSNGAGMRDSGAAMPADRLGAERGMPEELVDARALHGRLVRVELHYVDVNGVAYRARFAYDGARKDLVGVSVAEESHRLITRNGVGSVAAAGFSMQTGDFAGATTVRWHTSYISREGAESADIRYYLLAPDSNGGADGKVVVIAAVRIDFGRPQMMIGVGSWRRIAMEGGSGRQARAEG